MSRPRDWLRVSLRNALQPQVVGGWVAFLVVVAAPGVTAQRIAVALGCSLAAAFLAGVLQGALEQHRNRAQQGEPEARRTSP